MNVAVSSPITGGISILSPESRFYIGVGPSTAPSFPGAARVNFTARSPQTGILGDSNTGGDFGPELKFAGYDQVILTGRAETLSYLLITDDGAELRDATHLKGLDTIQTQAAIKKNWETAGSRLRPSARPRKTASFFRASSAREQAASTNRNGARPCLQKPEGHSRPGTGRSESRQAGGLRSEDRILHTGHKRP